MLKQNTSIDGQLSLFEDQIKKAKTNNSDVAKCRYSGFKCNKEYRFVVAEGLNDNMCPHVCCRLCSELLCGVRCSGAGRDVSPLSYKQIEQGFKNYGTGDYPRPELRPDWYDVMLLYRYRLGNIFKTIEVMAAYKDFTFNLYGLPSDAPKTTGEIIAWRYLREDEI